MPRENGCAVRIHRYHIRCMERSLREVPIPQVIWLFCMYSVMAIARSLVFEAFLTRLNSFIEKRSGVFLQVGRIVAIHKYLIATLCQSYVFLLQPFFAKILSKLSQLLNKFVQRMLTSQKSGKTSVASLKVNGLTITNLLELSNEFSDYFAIRELKQGRWQQRRRRQETMI